MTKTALLFTLLALAACQPSAGPTDAATADSVSTAPGSGTPAEADRENGANAALLASVVTEAVSVGAATDAAFLPDPASPDSVLLIGATGLSGLQLFGPGGERLGGYADIESSLVDVLPEFEGRESLVLAYDSIESTLRPFEFEPDARLLAPLPFEPVEIDDELVGLCSYRSLLSGSWYVFGVTDAGLLLQWELHRSGGAIGGRFIRSIPSGKGGGFCVVDPNDGALYVSDEEFGVWRFSAEPESETVREAVDLREPWGRLGEEVKGIGLYRVNLNLSYLLLADAGASLVRVYSLPGGDYLGAAEIPGLSEPEGMGVINAGGRSGWFAIADEDATDGTTEIRAVAWDELAAALGLERAAAEIPPAPPVAVVPARAETPIVPHYGDATDDPAIWVHPHDPQQSLVLGTNKQAGLSVYDLEGRELQFLPDGQINNVDVRDGFPLGGASVSLVVAGNRSDNSLAIYRVDAGDRRLVAVADGHVPSGLVDTYGFCMYRSASGEYYAFANNAVDGRVVQSRLFESSPGRVGAEVVREFVVGSQAEGCVADDETGILYVAEETVGIYRYSAEPDGGDHRVVIDTIESGERLTEDIEGLALWIGAGGTGYLIASNQGADNFVVYRREGANEYVGTFHVIGDAAAGIDGVSETDGLEVISTALGANYPAGLMVAQDGRNLAPPERQNFKYASWQDIAAALGLD